MFATPTGSFSRTQLSRRSQQRVSTTRRVPATIEPGQSRARAGGLPVGFKILLQSKVLLQGGRLGSDIRPRAHSSKASRFSSAIPLWASMSGETRCRNENRKCRASRPPNKPSALGFCWWWLTRHWRLWFLQRFGTITATLLPEGGSRRSHSDRVNLARRGG